MADRSCYMCEEKESQGPGFISFDYDGFSFRVWRSGLECEDCAREEFIEDFNNRNVEFGSKLVTIEDDKIEVNWSSYLTRENCGDSHYANKILTALGILTHQKSNNWGLTDGMLMLSPSSEGGGCLVFSRKEDAVEYAKCRYGNARYPIMIFKFSNTLNLSDEK